MHVGSHVSRAGNRKHFPVAIEEMLVDCERLTTGQYQVRKRGLPPLFLRGRAPLPDLFNFVDPETGRVCELDRVEGCSCVDFVKTGREF